MAILAFDRISQANPGRSLAFLTPAEFPMAQQRQARYSRTTLATLQKLESLERAGVKALAKPRAGKLAAPLATAKPTTADTTAAIATTPRCAPANRPAAQVSAKDSLEIVRREVAACTLCDELAGTRTQTVFGVGNPQARLCFLGEAPGADEDRQGEPFVGRAGQLLTKIIEACTLTRQDVYILNVLKCRPPGNRNPLPDEVSNCRGFLDRQLSLIRPEYICCLGTIAAQTLLETDTPISRMRGKFFDYHGIPVMCTYHPAYLLRNPAAKKDVWDDMKVLMRKLGIELDKTATQG
jgi:uracil-DNA glycosylase